MTRILLLGSEGQVGWELHRSLNLLGSVTALNRGALDLADEPAIRAAIQRMAPNLIVNAAAYTAVDLAEKEQESAFAINAHAPALLAEEARRCGAFLIHYSTDYVFDGLAKDPYVENSITDPLNIYGASKLAGELAIQKQTLHYLILRTSWVYGMRGRNFLNTMLRLGRERPELKIVNDQIGAPTWSRMIAEASTLAAQHVLQLTEHERQTLSGVYHLTASGSTTWFHFAQAIFAGLPPDHIKPNLLPIPTSDYPTPAKRPNYSVLSNDKFIRTFGVKMPAWDTSLKLCLEDIYMTTRT